MLLLLLLLLLEVVVVRRVDALRWLRRTRVLLILVLLLVHAGALGAEPAAAANAGRVMVATARRMIEPGCRGVGRA